MTLFMCLRKISVGLLAILFLCANVAFAEGVSVQPAGDAFPESPGTILPGTDLNVATCEVLMAFVDANASLAREAIGGRDYFRVETEAFQGDFTENMILGCGIKTGALRLWMVPFFVRYILQFIIALSGVAAMGGIVYGGFMYLFAGLSDDKEKGKKAILYGVVGFVLTLLAWAIVNLVIAVVT